MASSIKKVQSKIRSFNCNAEETSQFNKSFMKIYNEDGNIGYFIETDV